MMAERLNTNRATHQIVVFGLSDRGLQRENNEDHFMVADLTRQVIGVHENHLRPELFHHDIGARGTILLVADGLGGHEGGEIASQLAVDTVARPSSRRQSQTCLCLSRSFALWTWRMKRLVSIPVPVGGRAIWGQR